MLERETFWRRKQSYMEKMRCLEDAIKRQHISMSIKLEERKYEKISANKSKKQIKMNKAIIIGNVGKDPEIKKFDNGQVANLTIATTEKYNQKRMKK